MRIVEGIGFLMFALGMGAPDSDNFVLAVAFLVVGGLMMNAERILGWIRKR